MWEKFQHTHNPIAVKGLAILSILFILTLSGAIIFGVSSYLKALNYEPIMNNEFSECNIIIPTTTNITFPIYTKNGQTEFILPQIRNENGPKSYTAYVNCTLTSNFIQNNPANVTVDILFPAITQADLNISTIFVQPINALPAYHDWTSETGYSSYGVPSIFLVLWETENYGALQVWKSQTHHNSFILIDSGLLELKITIYANPTDFAYNNTDWETYLSNYQPFVTTVTIPNTYVTSIESTQLQQAQYEWQQSMLTQVEILQSLTNQSVALQEQWQNQQKDWSTQQDINADGNLSLTLFVLALMIFDAMIVILDHSVDENKKAEYENEQAKKSQNNKIKRIDNYF